MELHVELLDTGWACGRAPGLPRVRRGRQGPVMFSGKKAD